MNAVDTFLDHEHFLFFCFRDQTETMPQEKVVPLAIEKTLGFIFLINKNRIFRANFVFDVESIDLRIPCLMRLRNSSKDNINISMKSDKYLNNSFLLVESIVLFTFKKSSIERSLTKIIKFFLRKQFDKNIRTNLWQILLILILVIFNNSQLTMIYLFHIFVNNHLCNSFLTR